MASAASHSSECEEIYCVLGVLGYQYEPLRQDRGELGSDNGREATDEDEEEELEEERANQEAGVTVRSAVWREYGILFGTDDNMMKIAKV